MRAQASSCLCVASLVLPKMHKHYVADLLDAHIRRGQLCKAEEADKVISGEAGDVQASLEVLQDCLHDYAKAACLQQLLQVLPQLPQQLRLHLRCRPALHLQVHAKHFNVAQTRL